MRAPKKVTRLPKNENVFRNMSEILVDGKTYLVERHFKGNRDVRDSVFAAVKNEANQKMST